MTKQVLTAKDIQAFANISVLQVAPLYYVIIGLILSVNFAITILTAAV